MSKERRSRRWYGMLNKDGFVRRSLMKAQGYPDHAFDGRPIIGMCNTWSESTPCNSGLRDLAEGVKRAVWEAGRPLAQGRIGDRIRVWASQGRLDLLVSDAELETRRAARTPHDPVYTRGYAKLYIDHVLQADQGADLDFPIGQDTRSVTRESHR